jgi:putative membrane protein
VTSPTEKNTPQLDDTTRLAYMRTRLSLERTMMSWVRTATSLITFGFAVYKFFQFELKGAEPIKALISPRMFGLMMIILGLVSLLMGTIQHVMNMRQIRGQWPDAPHSVAAMLAALVAALGLGALITAIFRQ